MTDKPSHGSNSFGQPPTAVAGDSALDLSQVLILSDAPINRIVLSRIVERAYLKATAAEPVQALRLLAGKQPGMVIVDIGAEEKECVALLDSLIAVRSQSPENLPLIVAVTLAANRGETDPVLSACDAIIAKPLTPEILQPVIERLISQAYTRTTADLHAITD